MQRTSHTLLKNLQYRPLQRIAALTGLVLTGLIGLVGTAVAQIGPLYTATAEYPTPYHSPVFHSGGASTPYPLAGINPQIDPLFPQLQGTPTGYFPQPPAAGAVPTQIPSFLLGDYLPAQPPAGAGVYYPNHFADGNLFSWSAPFSFVPQTTGSFTVDDTLTTAIAAGLTGAGSVFAATANWNPPVTTGNEAGTATGGEYLRLIFGLTGSAVWTLTASSPGSYAVYFHIPDNIDDGAGNVETRNTNVTYEIAVTTATGVTNTAATVSQTEANSSQFLAGPFQLQAGDTVTVTLERKAATATTPAINNLSDGNSPPAFGQYDLIADSMTLQASFGDVQSTPTAIDRTAYRTDFLRAVYWGITPNTGATPVTTGPIAGILGSFAAPDVNGGTPVLRYGDPTKTTDASHLIRQLVYFGRSEPAFTNQASVDDSNFVGTGFTAGFTPGDFTTVVASGTATQGEYSRAAATNGAGGNPAIWAIPAPNGGNYFVTVHLPGPTLIPAPAETRALVHYKVFLGATQIGPAIGFPVNQGLQAGQDVLLPTGPIPMQRNQVLTVSLSTATTDPLTTPVQSVVADSVRINTGTGAGAIYCVDGFTGAVVWRFETPPSLNGPSAPVFSSPAVARINVLTGTNPATYANRLVVIVGDNNGLVYCLDAIGNGDGTSNANVIDPNTGQPIYIPQPAYGTAPVQVGQAGYTPHVGTTGAYWIYRPDATRPKNIATGTPRVDGQGNALLVSTSDLPTPAAFGTASPTIFVDPSVNRAAPITATDSNATVYVGNSNGVLYALDAMGVPIDGTTATTFADTGDLFNVSQDLRVVPNVFPAVATDPVIPTCQPKWWFTLRGPSPNSPISTSSADIESAPAVYVDTTTTPYTPHVYIGSAHEQESTSNVGRLYALNGLLGPSGNNGKSNPATQTNPAAANYTGPGSVNYNVAQKPQTSNTDTTDWTFPDALDTVTVSSPTVGFKHQSSNGLPRPALGNITGSPVVFTNFNHETFATRQTRIYFAANVGIEIPAGSAAGTAASVRPDDTQTGRIWAVNLDGSIGTTTSSGAAAANGSNVWTYPLANDPNDQTKDIVPEPLAPIGAFLHATPAIGFVQFPSQIDAGNNNPTPYNPVDSFYPGGLKGKAVPMLYAATSGVNDMALYAVDIDGTQVPGPVTATIPATPPTASTDTQTIYRQISPDGSLFESSPVLITNSTNPPGNPPGPGNGGTVLLTAGNTLFDFSATPISNPITSQNYPLIREDRAYTGFGPISGPALAAADVTDLQGFGLGSTVAGNINSATQNVTDWVYVGDSSTGYCRGITPNDLSDANIPIQLGGIVPPDANAPGTVNLSSIIQAYLVTDPNKIGSTDARPVTTGSAQVPGPKAPLPVYEWGENVYIRFKNVVPPNPATAANPQGDPALYLRDNASALTDATSANPITVYSNGGPVEFDLSEVDDSAANSDGTTNTAPVTDHGTVPALTPIVPASTTTPLANGFYKRSDTITAAVAPALADPTSNLVDASGNGYIGAYTYAISDGSARRNTPGGRRQVINAHQTVLAYTTTNGTSFSPGTPTTIVLSATATNGNEVTTVTSVDPVTKKPTYGLKTVAPVDQPTFGILNPLGLRAGGIPLPTTLMPPPTVNAQQIGDDLGPFRPASSPISSIPKSILAGSAAQYDLEALTNGNSVYQGSAPPSTAGLGDPTKLIPLGGAGSIIPPANPYTVVTSTPLIRHNTGGDNSDLNSTNPQPTGNSAASAISGLTTQNFGYAGAPYAANIFDRTPLGLLGNRSVNAKMNVPNNGDNTSGTGGLYWNDNSPSVNGHKAVVNYLPWETAPGSYQLGSANSSPDYPDISPQNITATLHSTFSNADLQAGSATLNQATGSVAARTVVASALQIHITVPHYQPANQQVYAAGLDTSTTGYSTNNGVPPLDSTGASNITKVTNAFPMGYITTRRIYVPTRSGRYQTGAAFRDISIYTGIPVDMSTSITNPTTDIGKVPAAFGVQTELYTPAVNPLGFFTPYNPAFQDYFKPLEIHNDGNVNLLNVHLDQKIKNGAAQVTLLLNSDAIDPLSAIDGYDLSGITGPRTLNLPGAAATVEEPFLIRSSVDTDLTAAYGPNPALAPTGAYAGATFHKPTPGGDAPSTLTVPDSPENSVPGYSLNDSPNGLPTLQTDPTNLDSTGHQLPYKSAPYVSLAVPFGTPVGTYLTSPPSIGTSLRLFEGLDTQTVTAYAIDSANPSRILYPPQYGGQIGGIGPQNTASLTNLDVYLFPQLNATVTQPISTTGTQLTATVVEQRLTDGNTLGAVPMIEAGSAGVNAANNTVSAPDFAPAAFRDPVSGNLSVYWTSGRNGPGIYDIFGANVPFQNPTNTNPLGYFYPFDATQKWWTSLGGYNAANRLQPVPGLAAGTNSGLSITQDYADTATPRNIFAFAVNVANTAAYNNTLFSYDVAPDTGALSNPLPITNDPLQVKYGVRGLYISNTAGFTAPTPPKLWAFWTASTRGRTTIGYNSLGTNNAWIPATGTTVSLLPIPAGLTSVADPSPIVLTVPVLNADGTVPPTTNATPQTVIEVTYSGTGPDGNVDLYASRYLPLKSPAALSASQLGLESYPPVTEILTPVTGSGWYQARDVAWSRTGQLNVYVNGTPILYDPANANAPIFNKATFDKASGLLVLTGISGALTDGGGNNLFTPATGKVTVYVDAATGRVRFTGGTPVKTAAVTALFNSQAKRLTTDSRADTAPITFLDSAQKPNATPALAAVEANRRWTLWRKSGTGGDPTSTTLYYKAQRLTVFLPKPIALAANGQPVNLTVDVRGITNAASLAVDADSQRGRIYFPITFGPNNTGTEGQPAIITYTASDGTVYSGNTAIKDTIEWQDEALLNDNTNLPISTVAGLNTVLDYKVPIDTAVNENNVAAFLDPFASATSEHKIWLFWNSTRNGTADIYSETINPRF